MKIVEEIVVSLKILFWKMQLVYTKLYEKKKNIRSYEQLIIYYKYTKKENNIFKQ